MRHVANYSLASRETNGQQQVMTVYTPKSGICSENEFVMHTGRFTPSFKRIDRLVLVLKHL